MQNYEKDKLAIENIISDYKIIFFKRIKLSVILLIILPPIIFPLIALVIKLNLIYKLILGFILLLLLWLLCLVIFALLREFKSLKDVTNKKFKIEVDILNKKEEVTVGRKLSADTIRILSFNKRKDYMLPKYLPLPSAKNFDLNEKELFDSSKIEDKFYLVIDTKDNILIVYSTQFFYLSN